MESRDDAGRVGARGHIASDRRPCRRGGTTIPMQPTPIRTRAVHYQDEAGVKTAIYRAWLPGESGPGGRCRLCDKCMAYGDACMIVVGFHVDRESAGSFSSVGLPDRTARVGGDAGATG